MFTIKNAVYVAVAQIWVIVIGVLASGLCVRAWRSMNFPLPAPVALLSNHIPMFLAVPVMWLTIALVIRNLSDISDDTKALAFLSGILILIALVIFVIYADITPWFHIDYGMDGGGD